MVCNISTAGALLSLGILPDAIVPTDEFESESSRSKPVTKKCCIDYHWIPESLTLNP